MSHQITLRAKEPVTHDVHQYVFDKPAGFDFTPGQATELSLERQGWSDEGRPFTFTSQPEDERLEFVIKSYPSHDGVTERLPTLEIGEEVEIEDPFGAIEDKGPGVFLAAGAGITPFIPILRRRARDGTLAGCMLIYANKTQDDIILREEWEGMNGLDHLFLVSEEDQSGLRKGIVDNDLIHEVIRDYDQNFYLCGPHGFVDDVRATLERLGADPAKIHTEAGW